MTPEEVRALPFGPHKTRLINGTVMTDTDGKEITVGVIQPFTSGQTNGEELIDSDDDVQFHYDYDRTGQHGPWQYVNCMNIELAYPDPGPIASLNDIEAFLNT
jgi:hypothetical protein